MPEFEKKYKKTSHEIHDEELIEKDEQTATPIAKASAKCWASKWAVVRPYFERTTGQRLVAGMKVLLKVYPQFHEAFGFSWIVTDIDPTYTLGDMARQRQEIIRQLKAEGVFDLQKELTLPLFCQRIAVISSETAAGYGDFCHQLDNNPYGFQFETHLFPAIMQGESTESSIINALTRIYDQPFDCVVIIRGGGATSDLSGFDTLALAEHVANFPIPIITGIGHERDECILDMVSHTRVKTPTAAAALLIEHLKGVFDAVEGAQDRITRAAQQQLVAVGYQLTALEQRIPMLLERRFTNAFHHTELLRTAHEKLPFFLFPVKYKFNLLKKRRRFLDFVYKNRRRIIFEKRPAGFFCSSPNNRIIQCYLTVIFCKTVQHGGLAYLTRPGHKYRTKHGCQFGYRSFCMPLYIHNHLPFDQFNI